MRRFSLLISTLVLGLGALPAYGALDIQHWETDKGMEVYFVPEHDLPIVDVRLTFDAGSARDSGLPGLAELTTDLLNDGAGEWDADQIAIRFDEVGALYSAGTGRDRSSVSLRSLSDPERLEQALTTFIKVVTDPTFPKEAIARAKRRTLVALRAQAQDPGTVAIKAFYRAVYGNHPYAHPVIGTPKSVRKIDREDLQDFHQQYFVASNAVLAIVGDIDRAEAEQLAARIDARLPEGEAPKPLPEVPRLDEGKLVTLPFPSEQANIFIGQPGIPRGAPDYFALYVGNHILGGSGFTSRLFKKIRVERGLAYSVSSNFIPRLVEGPFLVGLQTRDDQARMAVELVRETVREFIKEGPTEKELEAATLNIIGSFPLRIDSNSNILAYLSMIGYYGLPLNYLDTFNERIKAVDAAEIRAAFQKELGVDRMVTVIVGGEKED